MSAFSAMTFSRGADTSVVGVFAYRRDRDARGIKADAVLHRYHEDLADHCAESVLVACQAACEHVGVARHAANVQYSEQHPALEHEPLGERRRGEPSQEALVDVELEQLLGVAPLRARELLQIKISLLRCAPAHVSRGSRTSDITEPIRSCRASASISPGFASCRRR